ncbi:MAG: lytic transglycosylase domain-containing protein [Sphingobium sp.]|nr:lytic transglycosylase domain-containing protein [Sphingobium sp.]
MTNQRRQRIRLYYLPLLGAVSLASVAVAQNSGGRKEIVQPLPGSSSSASGQQPGNAASADGWDAARASINRSANSPIILAVDQWKRLQQSDGLGFDAYAGFVMAHPGWPAEDRMRRLAESSINPNSYSPGGVIAFFQRFPARSATGQARYAQALAATGRQAEARDAARAAWRMGALSETDELQFLGLFGSALSPLEHAIHADAALWARNTSSAERSLPYLSANDRLITEARIALQRKSVDAAAKMQAAEPYAKGHAGFIADKASWLRDNGNSILARSLLAEREALTTRPANVEKWYEVLLSNARAAANDQQWSLAYNIASKLDDAYPAGTDVSLQSLGERDDYTSLAWLAGTAALNNIARPRDAMVMFDKYASAARSPQTMTKGWYWAARAAQAGSDAAEASRHLNMAAGYPDQFYGQLARERLGQPIPAPSALHRQVTVTSADRSAFNNLSIVQAAQELGRLGRWSDQSIFLRALAANVSTDAERVLSDELAMRIGRPDLGVMIGRRAKPDGSTGYATSSFPSISVPDGHNSNWTMIHAITRQESQFDKAAVSHAGARGLMQLMPGTARETAGRVGLSYNVSNLTSDTQYNVQLGSTYFQQMLNYYNGSYPLAVAAYNAGPGNVNKWLRAYGDPRTGGVDILDWIEQIPFMETKGYVQRVLENAVVYDAIRAEKNGTKMPSAPLSFYLGKRTPG